MPTVSVTVALILHYLSLMYKRFPRCWDLLLFEGLGVCFIYLFIFSVFLLDPEDALKYRFIIVCSVTPVSKRRKNKVFFLLLKFLVVEWQLWLQLRCVSHNLSWRQHFRTRTSSCSDKILAEIDSGFSKLGQRFEVVALQACRLQVGDVSASLGQTVVLTCCSLFPLSESPGPAQSNTVSGKWLLALSCWLFFSFLFFFCLVPEQSEVLRQYVCTFSLASLDDYRTQTLECLGRHRCSEEAPPTLQMAPGFIPHGCTQFMHEQQDYCN